MGGPSITTWQQEYGGARRPFPLLLLAAGAGAAWLLSSMGGHPATVDQGADGKPATVCQEHAGRPGWDAVCPATPRRPPQEPVAEFR